MSRYLGFFVLLVGCNLVSKMDQTTEAIDKNREMIEKSTQVIADNASIVAESSKIIETNKDLVAQSNQAIFDNMNTVKRSNSAIRENVTLIDKSNALLEKNGEVLDSFMKPLSEFHLNPSIVLAVFAAPWILLFVFVALIYGRLGKIVPPRT